MGFETIVNVNGYRNGFKNGHVNGNGVMYGYEEIQNGRKGDNIPLINGSSPSNMSSSSSLSPIEHHVTKMDTLAGIAIRYGVEVADIKKMNGLVTDLQMYALKTLQIPLPGRHPPSHCVSNGHSSASFDETPSSQMQSDVHESFKSLKLTADRKLSPAMCSLRDYYGLNTRRNSSEGYEMAVYSKGSISHQENEAFLSSSSSSSTSTMNPPFGQHRRSRSVANGFKTEEDDLTINVDAICRKYIGKLNTQTQKTEETRTPEKLLKEENGSGGWFSAMTGKTGKGLALRTKAASRTNLASDGELGGANGFPNNIGEYIMGEGSSRVRKSSSTPSFQDQDGNGNLSIWKTSTWSLKPDLQALANPIFDGLPKPISGRKSKAALD